MEEFAMDPGFLRTLIFKIRAIMTTEETVMPDPGGNAADDEGPAVLQEQAGDLTRDEIVEEINGLDDEQQAELVALMWLGRDDGEAEDWDELMTLAQERHEGPTADYLLDHPAVADYWLAGLDKLGLGASVLEDGKF